MSNQTREIEQNGFAVVPICLPEQTVEHLCLHFANTKHAQRNLLQDPGVRELAVSEPVRQAVAAVLGRECFSVRGL